MTANKTIHYREHPSTVMFFFQGMCVCVCVCVCVKVRGTKSFSAMIASGEKFTRRQPHRK